MVLSQVKKEATGRRPSALSDWYRQKLGRDVAISDIDWMITSISNKDTKNRYLIIEEKNISHDDTLLVGLGQGRSLKEVKQDIVRENIPIFVIFVKDNNLSSGAWIYEFNPEHIDDKSNWVKVGESWYVNLKKYAEFCDENKLIDRILKKVGSTLR